MSHDGETHQIYFPTIKPIKYNPQAPREESLVFRHYDKNQIILGRSMEDWLRFSVCYWHTFRGNGSDPFGSPTREFKEIEKIQDPMAKAKARLTLAFELFTKLGIKFWTCHDVDIAPEGSTLAETHRNLDEIAQLAKQLQDQTGIKLLWGTANLFSHPRYMNGAATNPDPHVFAMACAQVKKMMEVTHFLGGLNYVFWGGREGYQCILNTDVRAELDHLGAFYRMVIEHKKNIGFEGQLLIEPKPKEPTKHQYDYDAQTVQGFLLQYGLIDHFKLNIEPNHTMLAGHSYEHDIVFASAYGILGSIDANTGDPSLGWDTDQFPMELKNAVLVMKTVIEQNGLGKGGLNFDCKVRRESTNPEDLFLGHIGAMDTFAKGLKVAAKIKEEGLMRNMVTNRYQGYQNTPLGQKVTNGTLTLAECEEYIHRHGEPQKISGSQEKYEVVLNAYVNE